MMTWMTLDKAGRLDKNDKKHGKLTHTMDEETRPNSWAKQVREIEWGHWTLDFMTF